MKGKYIVISLIITVALFFMLIYAEKKISGTYSNVEILVVKQDVVINKYDKLDKSMFEVKKVPAFLSGNAVLSFNEIENMCALTDILEGEVLRKEKVGNKDNVLLEVATDKRTMAISVNSLADGIAGQLRKNTYVDILFTNSPTTQEPNIKTETVFEKVKVIGVTDANGNLIDGINEGQISAVLLEVTPQEAHVLANKERKGKFRLIGVPQNAQPYEKIVVK